MKWITSCRPFPHQLSTAPAQNELKGGSFLFKSAGNAVVVEEIKSKHKMAATPGIKVIIKSLMKLFPSTACNGPFYLLFHFWDPFPFHRGSSIFRSNLFNNFKFVPCREEMVHEEVTQAWTPLSKFILSDGGLLCLLVWVEKIERYIELKTCAKS